MAKCQNCDHGMVLVPYPDEITDEGVVSGGDDHEVCPCCNGDWEHCPTCVELMKNALDIEWRVSYRKETPSRGEIMTETIHLNWQAVNDALVKPASDTKNRAFLICPVKDHGFEDWMTVVQKLEGLGWAVHYPPLDTNQDDPVGLRICQDNLAAISRANVVFIIWDGISKGCLFDLGMAFALGKRIIWVALPDWGEIDGKNWEKVIRAMQEEQ